MKTSAGARQEIACTLFLMALTAGASCVPTAPRTGPADQQRGTTAEALTVFFTGNTLGALKPCGCSGGQLGGLERRRAILDTVPRQERLVVDTGSFVKSDGEQDLIKYNIIVQALQQLDYDAVVLSDKDIEIGMGLGQLDGVEPGLALLGPYGTVGTKLPAKFTRKLSLQGRTVAVTIAAFDAKSASIDRVRGLFPPQTGVYALNILVVNQCDPGTIESIAAAAPSVDCLVCPAESDEPMVVGDPDKKPLVFSVGRFGRHVCKLQIETAAGKNALKLSLHVIPVSEDLEKDASLVSLYKDYQQLVRESNLLAIDKHPRFALPNNLEYVGSLSCKPCHDYEYQRWQDTTHAKAYATLEQAGSQADPECVVCHVVGLDYQSGFISLEKTGDLKDVGCENCHGPGSEHVRSGGRAKSADPKSTCTDCHTPEQSGEYAGNESSFLEKIIHWKEPNAANHVK